MESRDGKINRQPRRTPAGQRGASCNSSRASLCSVTSSRSPPWAARKIASARACTCLEWTGSGSEATAASSAASITEINSGGNDALEKSFMTTTTKRSRRCQHALAAEKQRQPPCSLKCLSLGTPKINFPQENRSWTTNKSPRSDVARTRTIQMDPGAGNGRRTARVPRASPRRAPSRAPG